jgi:AAA ATPase domain
VTGSAFGIRELQISGFRSARSVRFGLGSVCALVGGSSVGKSNLLVAAWMLLQRGTPAPQAADLSRQGAGAIHLSAVLGDGGEVTLDAAAPGVAKAAGPALPVLFLPASRRSEEVVAHPIQDANAGRIAEEYFSGARSGSSTLPATTLVGGLERLCDAGERGLVLLVEEPELFLRPQAQRYLYRLLRAFADSGNQVIYSTHGPAFLNVGRLGEVALVDYEPGAGTTVIQPEPLSADESFRAISEVDAERGELFLARAVLLVEGRTEKQIFPFVFRALGHDEDREAITILDCGGKPNIPLFIGICHATRVPCVAVHDRDAPPGRRPSHPERILNAEIARLAGPRRTVVLSPDFEAVAGLRGHRHKPARAWERFSDIERGDVPPPLLQAVESVVSLARA